MWRTLVPPSGQAASVQGELIRAVERLRWEAQNNGNQNWDAGSELFCTFIETTLLASPNFSAQARAEITADVGRLRDIEDPYTEDDLYDRLVDRIVEFHRAQPGLIPRGSDPRQPR
jgi:hypothetical protein